MESVNGQLSGYKKGMLHLEQSSGDCMYQHTCTYLTWYIKHHLYMQESVLYVTWVYLHLGCFWWAPEIAFGGLQAKPPLTLPSPQNRPLHSKIREPNPRPRPLLMDCSAFAGHGACPTKSSPFEFKCNLSLWKWHAALLPKSLLERAILLLL